MPRSRPPLRGSLRSGDADARHPPDPDRRCRAERTPHPPHLASSRRKSTVPRRSAVRVPLAPSPGSAASTRDSGVLLLDPRQPTEPRAGGAESFGTGDAGGRRVREIRPPANETPTGVAMSKPFKGVINLDVRDSVPDWE